ncbi:MurR/RpiR family transcriptional regulator [Enterococcus sp. JM9B]|uniref:MurR/RpiR family transcriptional regulator n=1 Tax=Enterococcus sp. JM9B TaxID=1857216 RepID=UPI001374B64A|nr:MurR/RpiR family transcriptional regulator [Enterococcus sp. JM9B]KAF1301628.1 transcriptional regulator [Enterococcus sp. JM9B]
MGTAFRSRIKSYYDDLSKGDQRLADYLLENSKESSRYSIQELAEATALSTATISRFAKKVGYQNFQELKLTLNQAGEEKNDFFLSLTAEDSYLTIAEKTCQTNIHSIEATQAMLTEKDLQKTMAILLQSTTCGFFGMGGSAVVALNAYHKFLRMPIHCFHHEDFHIQLMQAAKMTKEDCALVISHTGRNKDTMELMAVLKKNGVPIIGITSYAGSPVAQASDVALISISEETFYRPEAISSVVSQLSIIDTLFLIYGIKMKSAAKETINEIREVIQDTRM